MNQANVQTKIHFGTVLPDQPAFQQWAGAKAAYPQARALAEECVAIPLCAGMDEQQVTRVIDSVLEFAHESVL